MQTSIPFLRCRKEQNATVNDSSGLVGAHKDEEVEVNDSSSLVGANKGKEAEVNDSTATSFGADTSPSIRLSNADAVHWAVNLDNIDSEAMLGQTVYVHPSAIRWTHGTIQRMFTCGRLLADVAMQLKTEMLGPEDLPMIELVKYHDKWYSRNNRRLWCFKDAGIPVVQARIGQVDNHFLRGLNTTSDGWQVDFFPPCICKRCGIEVPNLKGLRWHVCRKVMSTSALDWDDQAPDASESDDSCSEDGDYGEDGCWHPDEAWSERLEADEYWEGDDWGRGPLWRASAFGNHRLVIRLLEAGAEVDDCDCEGVSPLLASVRRGHWYVAEVLLWYGANQTPWKWTARKGKKWSGCRASRYERVVAAVNSGRSISKRDLTIRTSKGKSKAKSKAKAKASKKGKKPQKKA